MHTVDTSVSQALTSLQSRFFSALKSGPEALISLDKAWVAFTTEVETCIDQLRDDTKAKIYSFSTTADIIASMLLEVDSGGDSLHLQLQKDVTNLLREEFSHLTIHDRLPASDSQHSAAYIAVAYKWLLENLHNPYPTRETRLEISTSTNSSLKDVDAWFADARKRIGWNQLRKEHFPKRGDLIKAATLFFKPSQSTIPASKSLRSTLVADRYLDFSQPFVQMEECAGELYSSKFVPSTFASELEKVESSTAQNTEINGQESTERRRLGYKSDLRSSYPSPEYSPGRASRSLSPPSPPTTLCTSAHNEPAGRKRRRSMSPDDPEQIEQPVSRTVKRSRFNAAESLPSPAASVDDSFAEGSSSNILIPASSIIPSQSSGKRKRAPSDVDNRVQKRPNIIPRTQSLQFSDPIRPAERLTEMNLEDLLVDVFGPNNEYAYGAAPVTSPSFDEINQFGVEFQYDFPYDIMIGNGSDREESASPGDTPELENVALPQSQLMSPSNVNDMLTFDVGNVSLNHEIPLAWAAFDMPPAAPGTEFWQAEQDLTNSASMISSGWSDDCAPIGLESLPPPPFWPSLDDFSNNASDYYNLPTTSGTLFSNFTQNKKPEQLSYDDKCQKINKLHQLLAQVEVLNSELAL